jgi:alanine-synthesizing transaminase
MNTDFYRIKRLPPYIFEEVNRLKAQSRARGEDIIDFGMGNPDMPTPDFIVDKLCETARDPRAHRYSASRGIKGLRKAHVAYYKRRFGVTLDPDREVIAALGSKEGFANLAMAITAPGDVVLVPNPAYRSRAPPSGMCPPPPRRNISPVSAAPLAIRCRRRWQWW